MKKTRGHIKARGKNSFSVVLRMRDSKTGEAKQKWITVKGDENAAQKELTKRLHEIDEGNFVEPSRMTVAEFLNQWLSDYAEVSVSPKTLERWTGMVTQHFIPALGCIRMFELRTYHLQRHYAQCLKDGGRKDGRKGGLSTRTVFHHHRLLCEIFGMAVKWGVIAKNPALDATPPKVELREVKAINIAESIWLLECAKGTRLYFPILLAVRLGLRRGEVLGCRFTDVDWQERSLVIRRSLEETKAKGVRFKPPKNGKARTVALSTSVLEEVRKLKDERGAADDDLICPGDDGNPWRPSAFTSAYRALLKRRKLAGPNFHALRHSHASQLIREKTDAKLVSARLGHSRTSFTLDVYGHLFPGQDHEAADRLDASYQAVVNQAPTKAM